MFDIEQGRGIKLVFFFVRVHEESTCTTTHIEFGMSERILSEIRGEIGAIGF